MDWGYNMKNDRKILFLEGIANGLMMSIGIPALISIISLWFHLPLLMQLGDQLSSMTYIMITLGIVLAFKDTPMMSFTYVILALLVTTYNMTYSMIILIVMILLVRMILKKAEPMFKAYQWLLVIITLALVYVFSSIIFVPLNDILIALTDTIASWMSLSIISMVFVLVLILVLYYTPFYMISFVLLTSHDMITSSHWIALLAMMTSTFFLVSKSNGYTKAAFYSYFAPWHITKLFIANVNVMLIALLSGVSAFMLNYYLFTSQFYSVHILPIEAFFAALSDGLDESDFVIILLTMVLPILITHTVYLLLKRRNRQFVNVIKI